MNTLIDTKLNNYTINDFLKLKPIIYEYCVNLTPAKSATSWARRLDRANDLYQDVYLYIYDNYFNKPKEPITEGRFIQRMKNCTYWTFYRQINPKYSKNRILNNMDYFEESEKSMFLFESKNFEHLSIFDEITNHPDYNLYTKGLSEDDKVALEKFLQGYTKSEVARMFNKTFPFISRIVKTVNNNAFVSDIQKEIIIKPIVKKEKVYNDLVFVREKVPHFEKVFIKSKRTKNTLEGDRKIRVYSLYLQKYSMKDIAKDVSKSPGQVGQEIYRINKKINNLCQV